MERTEWRNGVLIYVATSERRFAVVGDTGIDSRVPEGFWASTASLMAEYFAAGRMAEGIVMAVGEAGRQLARLFPCTPDNRNELPDEISFGR
jgi:uncharacterized membrane protein